jgi:glycosyltransferase involved in cell wall biosynthesis
MRVTAILSSYNEERFIAGCLTHHIAHGLSVYLLDNDSTDRTVEIARTFLGKGLLHIERHPRHGQYDWQAMLERKAALASTLDADWFLHVDADEARLPPRGHATLVDAIRQVDAQGYNAINFAEFSFVPTVEEPDHDHPRYVETMRYYYPFKTDSRHRVNLWRRQPVVDLASSGGHAVAFPGRNISPENFRMRHYLLLSKEHARHKYVERVYNPDEVAKGWHGARARLLADDIRLPSSAMLRHYISDDDLDPTDPEHQHQVFGPALFRR